MKGRVPKTTRWQQWFRFQAAPSPVYRACTLDHRIRVTTSSARAETVTALLIAEVASLCIATEGIEGGSRNRRENVGPSAYWAFDCCCHLVDLPNSPPSASLAWAE